MARFGLWVAALSLVCFIAAVTSDDENICPQFFNDGSTMTPRQVFKMVEIHFSSYVPDLSIEVLQEFMGYADADQDNHLNQAECENLISYIKQRTPGQK